MKLIDMFLTEDPSTVVASDLWVELKENVEDLIPFARAAAPAVIKNHEDALLEEQLAAAIAAGIAVGWAARKEAEGS
jgi:hypothetical protein